MSLSTKRSSLLFVVAIVALAVLTAVAMSVATASADSNTTADAFVDGSTDDATPADTAKTARTSDAAVTAADVSLEDASAGMYIVVLNDTPLASYRGGVPGLAATNPQAVGADKLDAQSEASQAYLNYLAQRRADTIKASESILGRDLDVQYEYGATLVGFATRLTAAEAAQLEALDSVNFVQREKISYPQTDAGPAWSGATGVWGGDWDAMPYMAELDGSQQVPPIASTASGMGEVTYNYYTNELTYRLVVTNPDGIELTMAHIHAGAAGANGPVVVTIFSTPSTDVSQEYTGTATLSDADEALLSNTEMYFNVHSTPNASGEIRGQIELDGTLGEGVVVGILDTGIDPWNPSFAAVGDDGYLHENPLGDGNYLGVCDPANTSPPSGEVAYDPTFPCNSKLIGVWGYTASDASPRDTDGHGSHTAGTVAGNFIEDSVITVTTVFTADISGVAPRANIIAYDVCADGGGCPGAALSAARDQALLDGVDVINYSIGSSAPTGDFWADAEALQWLALRDAGVFVATSNGNAGPGDATTGSPADTPWITSVGANSHDRKFEQTLILTDGTDTVTVTGEAMTGGFGPADVVFSSDYVVPPATAEDARLCAPGAFPAGTFSGEIVVCERGSYGRVAKGQSVLDGGAGGYVLAQPEEFGGGPGALASDPHVLPAVHIDYNNYQTLRQFVITDSVATVEGTFTGAVLSKDPANGDIMASFSSRGPQGTDADLIVPKVTAPGRAIWAPYAQGPGGDGDYTWFVIQGTSMSSPHTAGAGALLSAANPGWSPAQMESALMLTARNTVLNDDGVNLATPFAQGAGHIVIDDAIMSPLAMDVTTAEYEDADPSIDNDFFVRDLNIASLGEDTCIGECSWVRTVTNVSDSTLTWEVSGTMDMTATVSADPISFTLAPGESQAVEISVDVSALDTESGWYFGTAYMNETSGMYPDAHMPIAVYPASGNLPETLEIETQYETGSRELDGIISSELTDLNIDVTGLVVADQSTDTLPQHPGPLNDFPAIFFASPTETLQLSREVVDPSFSIVAEIAATESPDLDMILFWDANGNDIPELSDVGDLDTNPYACQSASGGSFEFCEIEDPVPGTYFILVVNWAASAPDADDPLTVAHAIVPMMDDAGNMDVTGPATNPAGEPYTLTVDFDLTQGPAVQANDKLYGAFYVGSSATMTGNIGTTKVYLDYLGLPEIAVDPTSVSVDMFSGLTSQEAVTITNNGNGDLDWATTIPPQGTDVVQDGSLELGYPNPYWDNFSNLVGFLPFCTTNCFGTDFARTGAYFGLFGGSSATAVNTVMTQTVTLPNTGNAFLNFYIGMGAAANADADFMVKMGDDVVFAVDETDASNYPLYTQVTIDASAYADGGTYDLVFEYVKTVTTADSNLNVFIDDISLEYLPAGGSCNTVDQIPFLSASPESGVVMGGMMDSVMLTFDATGYTSGTYTDTLCVSSNDPVTPIVPVDVEMNVTGNPPTANVDVSSIDMMVDAGESMTASMTISNTGDVTLTYDIETDTLADTMAPAKTTLLSEGFEENLMPPTGWSVVDAPGSANTWTTWAGPLTSGAVPYSGDYAAGVFWSGDANPVDTWLISPQFDIVNRASVEFWTLTNLYWCRDTFDNCDLDAWLVIGDPGDADDIYLGKADDDWAASGTWTYHQYVIDGSYTDVRIGFQYTAADGDLIALDSVMVSEVAACEAPEALSWLTIDPMTGEIEPMSADDVSLTMDSTGLPYGMHEGTICLNTNDPVNPLVKIPVSMEVMTPTTQLRVAHLAPFADSGTEVTVKLNGTEVLTDFGYLDSTQYITVTAGTSLVQVEAGGSTVISAEVDFMQDMQYTVLATGGANGYDVAPVVLVDDNSAPDAGKAKVRIGHLAPFAMGMENTAADVRLDDGTVILPDVEFTDVMTNYLQLDAGEYDLEITAAGTDNVLIDLAPVTLGDGDILYVFATGDGTNQPVGAFAYPTDLQGFALPLETEVPQLMVSEDGNMVENGVSMVDFMTTTVGTPITKTFTVSNTGSADLMLSNLTISGTGFTTVDFMTTTVAPGEATNFYVVLDATAVDSYSATVSFDSNDEMAMSFTFEVMGVVTEEPVTEYTIFMPLISK